MLMAGTDDPLMLYEGGNITGPFGVVALGKVRSVDETISLWVNSNDCILSPVTSEIPGKYPENGTLVHKSVYIGCYDSTEVILYTIENGGHAWPGCYQYLYKGIIGNTCIDINANEIIWKFFKRH